MHFKIHLGFFINIHLFQLMEILSVFSSFIVGPNGNCRFNGFLECTEGKKNCWQMSIQWHSLKSQIWSFNFEEKKSHFKKCAYFLSDKLSRWPGGPAGELGHFIYWGVFPLSLEWQLPHPASLVQHRCTPRQIWPVLGVCWGDVLR